jgi:hypothetical protein
MTSQSHSLKENCVKQWCWQQKLEQILVGMILCHNILIFTCRKLCHLYESSASGIRGMCVKCVRLPSTLCEVPDTEVRPRCISTRRHVRQRSLNCQVINTGWIHYQEFGGQKAEEGSLA